MSKKNEIEINPEYAVDAAEDTTEAITAAADVEEAAEDAEPASWEDADETQKSALLEQIKAVAIYQKTQRGDGVAFIAVNPKYIEEFESKWQDLDFEEFEEVKDRIHIQSESKVTDIDLVLESQVEMAFLNNWAQRSGLIQSIQKEIQKGVPLRITINDIRAAYIVNLLDNAQPLIVPATSAGLKDIKLPN